MKNEIQKGEDDKTTELDYPGTLHTATHTEECLITIEVYCSNFLYSSKQFACCLYSTSLIVLCTYRYVYTPVFPDHSCCVEDKELIEYWTALHQTVDADQIYQALTTTLKKSNEHLDSINATSNGEQQIVNCLFISPLA